MASDLCPTIRTAFQNSLAALGFIPAADESDAWDGTVPTTWVSDVDASERLDQHRVRVQLSGTFPFQKPSVLPLDEAPPIRNERHQEAGSDNAPLCLYPDQGPGWAPWITANELVERIRTWFVHYHQNDWPPEDRPPDLHLYFPAKSVRPLMMLGDDWLPPQECSFGRFGVWVKPADYRGFAGHPVASRQIPAPIGTDRLLPFFGLAGQRSAAIGLWFRLLREPRPHETLAEMLGEIDAAAGMPPGAALRELKSLFGERIRGRDALTVLALGYSQDGTTYEWLFLRTVLPASRKNHKRWGSLLGDLAVESYETASASRESLMRRTGHTARCLEGKRVCIFGQGAIGSSVSLLLSKTGVPALHLVDGDRLRPGNTVRHAAGLSFVGALKGPATRLEALSHAPDCQITTDFATWDARKISDWVSQTDVVVDATASPNFSLLLNEICVRQRKPAVYAASYRRAAVGRVQAVRPGEDACLVCHAAYSRDAEEYEYTVIPPGEEGEFVEGGCGLPTVEASAIDVEATANMTARMVLKLLQEQLGIENECFVVNEALPDASGLLSRPGLHWASWSPLKECETCQAAQKTTNAVD